MKIIENDTIFNQYFAEVSHNFRRSLSSIKEITIHGSGGSDTATGIIKWMSEGGELKDGTNRIKDYKKGISLFHFEIDSNGDIYELIPIDYFVYHSSSGRHDKITVGIEIVQTGENNSKSYSIDQYNSLCSLIKFIMDKCPIEVIAGHSVTSQIYSGTYKNHPPCPGIKFDWDLIANNFDVEQVRSEMYKIKNA